MVIEVERTDDVDVTDNIKSYIKTEEKENKKIALKLLDLLAEYDSIESISAKIK